ncbi:MAG: metallophosphoesterase [Chthoniobacterales bacterium]|nr:metallophosphoesterase [Chthoniobacterales bacterium]
MRTLTRRKFLGLGLCALPAAAGLDGRLVEPTWLRVTKLELYPQPSTRFAHFSDFHYKGDAEYAAKIVETINGLEPEFVCFTGDLVEDKRFAPAALDFIRQIKRPVYGCPGNWDYASRADFKHYQEAFAATGGAWLEDRSVVLEKPGIELIGMGLRGVQALGEARAVRRVLLIHYPTQADRLDGRHYDLILAGHSHGGQVRLPLYGALVLPYGVGRYELGRFDSLGGPLYVSAGVGTYLYPVRFNCRPEITVIGI